MQDEKIVKQANRLIRKIDKAIYKGYAIEEEIYSKENPSEEEVLFVLQVGIVTGKLFEGRQAIVEEVFEIPANTRN